MATARRLPPGMVITIPKSAPRHSWQGADATEGGGGGHSTQPVHHRARSGDTLGSILANRGICTTAYSTPFLQPNKILGALVKLMEYWLSSCTIQYNTMYNTLQYNTIHCTIQYNTMYNTLHYSTAYTTAQRMPWSYLCHVSVGDGRAQRGGGHPRLTVALRQLPQAVATPGVQLPKPRDAEAAVLPTRHSRDADIRQGLHHLDTQVVAQGGGATRGKHSALRSTPPKQVVASGLGLRARSHNPNPTPTHARAWAKSQRT